MFLQTRLHRMEQVVSFLVFRLCQLVSIFSFSSRFGQEQQLFFLLVHVFTQLRYFLGLRFKALYGLMELPQLDIHLIGFVQLQINLGRTHRLALLAQGIYFLLLGNHPIRCFFGNLLGFFSPIFQHRSLCGFGSRQRFEMLNFFFTVLILTYFLRNLPTSVVHISPWFTFSYPLLQFSDAIGVQPYLLITLGEVGRKQVECLPA